MKTVCHEVVKFSNSGKKNFLLDFSGGRIATDGGAILAAGALAKTGIAESIAACLTDSREQGKVRHPLKNILTQRLSLLVLGYKDCNDSNVLRKDPVIKSALGIAPESGPDLATQSTLSRLENRISGRDIVRLQSLLISDYVKNLAASGRKDIVLDIDSTDDETHGCQEGSLFNGYYQETMYSQLLIFDAITGELATAKLEKGTKPSSFNAVTAMHKAIAAIRKAVPDIRITVRGDSGYGIPALMDYCERNGVYYILGIKGNDRLYAKSLKLYRRAVTRYTMTDRLQSYYGSIDNYSAKSWRVPRQIYFRIAYGDGMSMRRFIVTNLPMKSPRKAYEFYAQRGQMENFIKELKNGLYSDRLSCHAWYANYFRLMLSAFAYQTMRKIRECLAGTELEKAEADTIRLRLFKVGAQVKETVRRVCVHLSSWFVGRELYLKVCHMLV